ncbi:MAG: hypothetical protein QNJ97_02415 [Myxococcota bacterium]|nr:hypothetical protein [Myxococcota bacterium]
MRMKPLSKALQRSLISIAVAAFFTTCDGEDEDSDANNDPLSEYNACDPALKVGAFRVDLTESYTGVQGRVLDGVVPTDIPNIVEEMGACRLLEQPNYICDPACEAGEVCNSQGMCIPYPAGRDMGTVTVTGMKTTVTMSATAPTFFYTNPGSLPHPGYAEGANITLDATGSEEDPFVLRGQGVGFLSILTESFYIKKDTPIEVAWALPAVPLGTARVRITLNLNNHGVSPKRIQCDTADTGSFSIPGDLITRLIDQGLSGFPTIGLSRHTADATQIAPGCVEFLVVSELSLPVEVEGVISCTDDGDCPQGQTCKDDLTCG